MVSTSERYWLIRSNEYNIFSSDGSVLICLASWLILAPILRSSYIICTSVFDMLLPFKADSLIKEERDFPSSFERKKLFFFCFRQADLYAYISILFHIYSVCECNEHQPTARLSQGFLYLQKHTLHQQIYTIISKYENKWGKSIDLLIWINHIHYNKVHSNKKAI